MADADAVSLFKEEKKSVAVPRKFQNPHSVSARKQTRCVGLPVEVDLAINTRLRPSSNPGLEIRLDPHICSALPRPSHQLNHRPSSPPATQHPLHIQQMSSMIDPQPPAASSQHDTTSMISTLALEKLLPNSDYEDWKALVAAVKQSKDVKDVLRKRYHSTYTFWTWVLNNRPPSKIFFMLLKLALEAEGDAAFREIDGQGNLPLHMILRPNGTNPAGGISRQVGIVAAVLALTPPSLYDLQPDMPEEEAGTPYGHSLMYNVLTHTSSKPIVVAVQVLYASAVADHAAFKTSHYPPWFKSTAVGRDIYKARLESDPRWVLRLDEHGRTPVERARLEDEGEDTVSFLRERMVVVKMLEEEFPGLSDEDFKLRLQAWMDL